MVETSHALHDIITILDNNRAFVEEFVNLVITQDEDVQALITHMDDFINYTVSIDELAGKSTQEVVQTQAMIDNVEVF